MTQVGDEIELFVDDNKHFRCVGKLAGTITFSASGSAREAIGIRSVAIKGTRMDTIPTFPIHLSYEAALGGSWSRFQSDEK